MRAQHGNSSKESARPDGQDPHPIILTATPFMELRPPTGDEIVVDFMDHGLVVVDCVSYEHQLTLDDHSENHGPSQKTHSRKPSIASV